MKKMSTLFPSALHRPGIFSPARKLTNNALRTKGVSSVLLLSLALCILALLVFNNAGLLVLHPSRNAYQAWSLLGSGSGYPGGGYPGGGYPGGGYPGGGYPGYPGGGYPGGGYPGYPGGGPGNPGDPGNPGSGGSASYLTPQDLWQLYNLPGVNGGEGQTIGEVIDGGLPTVASDLNAYSQRFGLPSCTSADGCLTIKYQGGQTIAPSDDQMEGLLDIEIMHAVAPKAHILVYITQSSAAGLARGPGAIIKTPGLKAINMSYGYDGNGKAYESIYKDNPYHVALVAASGDNGHTTLTPPGIYPEVIAVGGTVVQGTTESAWNKSGGGQTSAYAEPAYQK